MQNIGQIKRGRGDECFLKWTHMLPLRVQLPLMHFFADEREGGKETNLNTVSLSRKGFPLIGVIWKENR